MYIIYMYIRNIRIIRKKKKTCVFLNWGGKGSYSRRPGWPRNPLLYGQSVFNAEFLPDLWWSDLKVNLGGAKTHRGSDSAVVTLIYTPGDPVGDDTGSVHRRSTHSLAHLWGSDEAVEGGGADRRRSGAWWWRWATRGDRWR